jgi:GMP synthase (glutamine-hydrolysing)
MTRVVLIRHTDDPEDDRVVTYLGKAGIETDIRRPFLGEALGEFDGSIAASVVYGGPFVVYEEDRHPFLREEHRWIERCIGAGVPLLGICQGAQSIARVLGAKVGPKPGEVCEFGYYELLPTPAGRGLIPDGLHVAQSHFHEFDLPKGANHLAGSRLFSQQAFRYGQATYGFQFHPEVTPAGFRRWQQAPWARYGKPGAQSQEEQNRLMARHDARQDRWFVSFLDRFFAPALAGT